MNKKDIDFGLKDIKIDDYKLKKNNSELVLKNLNLNYLIALELLHFYKC